MFQKNRLFPLILILAVIIVWRIRDSKEGEWVEFSGQTMGTTYSIKYESSNGLNLKEKVDSILILFNNSVSTYIENSEISRFNRDSVLYYKSPYFYPVLLKSKEVFSATGGAFDPTVMPLVNAWGFGPGSARSPDKRTVDSLKQFVDFNLISFDQDKVWKSRPGVQLDFSAIAKGYGVDLVGKYLHDQGMENYFVEIGGEVVASGINDKGTFWRLGVEDPTDEVYERKPKAVVELDNKGMATSGNYRNFYMKDGIKYAHTIDPKTGYPVEHSLLSATVLAPDCMTADAFATAFMVLGLEKAKELLVENIGLEAFLIYDDPEGNLMTYSSEGVDKITILE